MGEVSSPGYTFIQKIDSSEVQIWVKIYLGQPAGYSFETDSNINYIFYLLIDHTTTKLLSVNTIDGSLNFAISESSNTLKCEEASCRIVVNNSERIYITLTDGTAGYICKYKDGSSFLSCIKTDSLIYAHSIHWISNQNFFLMSIDSGSTSIEFKLINFPDPSITWRNSMTCSLSCNANFQQSDLDPKRSIVYTSANVDSYIYITSFNLTDGSLAGQRYISSYTTSHGAYSLKFLQRKILIVTELLGNCYFTIIELSSQNVKSYLFNSGINIYSIDYEQISNRLVFVGGKTSDTYAYISKTFYSTILELSDLQRNSNVFVEETVSDKQINFNSGTTSILSIPNYLTNGFAPTSVELSIDSNTEFNYTSDASYWFDNIYANHLTSNTQNNVSANLICSISGSNSISYSFSADYGYSIPSWGSIDSENNKTCYKYCNSLNNIITPIPNLDLGVYKCADGARYEGHWRKNKVYGFGKLLHSEGEWKHEKQAARGAVK